MAFSRKLYIIILIVGIVYNVTRSCLYVLEEPTSFQESRLEYYAVFPSVTFCVRLNAKDNYKTFNDLKEDLEEFKGFFKSTYKVFGKGVKEESFDLKDSTVLQESLNVSLDYVWESSAMILPEWKYCIVPCMTLNPPPIPSPKRGRHFVSTIVTYSYYL